MALLPIGGNQPSITARVAPGPGGGFVATDCLEGTDLPCPAILDLSGTDPSFLTELMSAITNAPPNDESAPLTISGTAGPVKEFPGIGTIGTINVSSAFVTEEPENVTPTPPLPGPVADYLNCVFGCLKDKAKGGSLAIQTGVALAATLKALGKSLPGLSDLRRLFRQREMLSRLPLTSAPAALRAPALLAAALGGLAAGDVLECFTACLPIIGRLTIAELPPDVAAEEMMAAAPETRTGGNPAFGPEGSLEGDSGSSSWGAESSRGALVGRVAVAPPQVTAMGATHLLVTSAGMVPLRTINQVARQTLDACAAMGQGARVVGAAQGGVLLVDFAWCLPLGRV